MSIPPAMSPCWPGAWCWPRSSPPTTAPATSSSFCSASPPTSAPSLALAARSGRCGRLATALPEPAPRPVAGGLAAGASCQHRHHHALPFLTPLTDCQCRWRHVTAGIFGMVVDLYLLLSTTYNLLDCHYPVPVSSPDNHPWIYSP